MANIPYIKYSMPKVMKFAIVGSIGFITDSAILYSLLYFGLTPLGARAFSIPFAMFTTWLINRNWSFEKSSIVWYKELAKYISVAGFSAVVNYCIYALALQFLVTLPILALVLGTGSSMFISYFGYSRVVFIKN